jgi:hypothetical protein
MFTALYHIYLSISNGIPIFNAIQYRSTANRVCLKISKENIDIICFITNYLINFLQQKLILLILTFKVWILTIFEGTLNSSKYCKFSSQKILLEQ